MEHGFFQGNYWTLLFGVLEILFCLGFKNDFLELVANQEFSFAEPIRLQISPPAQNAPSLPYIGLAGRSMALGLMGPRLEDCSH